MRGALILFICVLFALYFVLLPLTGGLGVVDARELPAISGVSDLYQGGWKAITAPSRDTSVGWASLEGVTPVSTSTATPAATATPASVASSTSGAPTATPTATSTPPPLVAIEDTFQDEFVGGVGSDVEEGWVPYVLDGPPTYDGERNTRLEAGLSQKISGHAPFRAGVYRQVAVTAGTPYTATISAQLYPLAEGTVRFGVDPSGGVDAASGGIVWQETTELGRWVRMTQTGTAAANTITVFLEVHNPTGFNTNAYFDELTVEVHPPV